MTTIANSFFNPTRDSNHADRHFGIGLARACGGALVFSLPMMMTMEMWQLGFYIDPWRLALLLLLTMPLLLLLARYMGFEQVFDWGEAAIDALVAFAVGAIVSTVVLALFAIIDVHMLAQEIINKVTLQAIPASIGALLAQSELGGEHDRQPLPEKSEHGGYSGELVVMAVGALYLAFNVAPTEEMVLIAYKMTPWHGLALALVSLATMHAFVYSVEFRGQERVLPGTPFWEVFVHFTIVGYALVLLISFYMLWTFGRLDGLALPETLDVTVVLGFPGAVGAAAARLIL